MDDEGSSPLVPNNANPSRSGTGTKELSVSPPKRRFRADYGYIVMTVTQVVGLCVVAFVVGAGIAIAMKFNHVRNYTTTGSTTPTTTIQTPTDQLFNNLRHPPSLLRTDKSRTKANNNLKIAWRKYHISCVTSTVTGIMYWRTLVIEDPGGLLGGTSEQRHDLVTENQLYLVEVAMLCLPHFTHFLSRSLQMYYNTCTMLSLPTPSLTNTRSHVLSEFRRILYVKYSFCCQ